MNQDFGGYQIQKRIGVGGMATVYAAVQKSLGRTVVLKTMHEHLREDKTFVARFEREAKAAAAMSHENIVKVIDYGLVDDTWYIAMEYVNGWDLKQWIERHGSPPTEIGTLILYDVCAGLAHAHAHHIIHRDIKPANIMLSPTGVPKIADFGLAKQTQESTVLTVHETMIGTIPYMSPEHATGQHVDERSDIFSLGVVAYEIFGGRRPFPGNSSASVINAIVTLDPLPLTNLNPLVTEELHRIVSKMLQKDPSKRYQSADAVRRDLETVIDEWGVTRGTDLITEYLEKPQEVKRALSLKRFKEHLNRAHQYKSMGLEKIDDAIVEFERAHYLAPDNKEVTRHLQELRAQKPSTGGLGRAPRGSSFSAALRLRVKRARLIQLAGASLVTLAAGGVWLLTGAGERAPGGAIEPPASPRTESHARVATSTPTAQPPVSNPGDARPEKGESEGTRAAEVRTAEPEKPASVPPSREKPSDPEPAAAAPEPAPRPRSEESAEREAPANGTLEITARPSATFVVNGRVIAENVSAVSLLFPPGEYDVRLENPYYGTKSWKGVEVLASETMALSHDFASEAKGAFLTVTTNRVPAMIWIDGAPTDLWTPQRAIRIAPGIHRVTVKKDGFRVEEGVVEAAIRDGATIELSFMLQEIPGN
ncbi:MAG: serine/threonine-protein kinase [Candidatus Eisenbacteria bacterium]